MRKSIRIGWLGLAIGLLAACSPRSASPLPPDLATGTAVVSAKFTQAAELTANPIPPNAVESYPTLDWTNWTPATGEITAADNGQTFEIGITSRISVVLDAAQYPLANLVLHCQPADALGGITNVESVPPQYYVVRYEGVQPGQCSLQNGDFEVTIKVVAQP
ncbi:hypothetical protein LARV_00612 [Longilinea arvoryzae]|uniref:Lipoprotein n=1 Tax=Longilinea arvoryzae TaxID=360412 RepID=A0A0S7BFL6_9CHLR|nr:hypothetical protein [Longilinea arvoryzae]GAP12872.1 hypothetical protein LARV_00612 [Longilinea arvoryzae]